MKKYSIFLLAAAALVCSCATDMDPFQGGDGIRANVNGRKCVMFDDVNTSYSYSNHGDTCHFSCSANMRLGTGEDLTFSIDMESYQPFVEGNSYAIGNGANSAYLKQYQSDQAPVLKGWLKFLKAPSESGLVEARFELENADYSVRHGFLRLYR